jgi:RND family efflux transporter MFP subunit
VSRRMERAVEAAEKGKLTGETGETRPTGAFTSDRYGLKPAPFSKRSFSATSIAVALMGMLAAGCGSGAKKPAAGPGAQMMPVRTVPAQVQPVAQSSDYMATIKSRRSATLSPQVSGILTNILVHSGEQVKAGQALMTIDSRQQEANVASLEAAERQQKASYDYNQIEVARQKQLFNEGIVSRQAYQQEEQTYENSKASYEAAVETRKTQQQLLDYYTVRAPFDGIVGDVPVHVGDYVASGSSGTMLTTVDENRDLEAYIYIPTERAADVRMGLGVDLLNSAGNVVEKTKIDFVSPQVDSTLQGILVKASVRSGSQELRNSQMVEARVIWSTKPMVVIPVLAVVRQNGISFVYVMNQVNGSYEAEQKAVTLGQTVGNNYAVPAGIGAGERVIVSGTQFLVNGMKVQPLPG